MQFRLNGLALASAIAIGALPGAAGAFPNCPDDSVYDGYTCQEFTGEGKAGGFFRVTFPDDWDGDLVIYNHGFDLEDRRIRPHETCAVSNLDHSLIPCQSDAECLGANDFCNNISYAGQDEILLPMGKAVAAGTYHQSGWAVFGSAKDIKDIIRFVQKDSGKGDQLKRVIVTGHSLGGAVTADATLKLKLDGAVPQCGAVGGGLPTWDAANEVRLVYDFLCDDVPAGNFNVTHTGGPDFGTRPAVDQTSMGLIVDKCLGNLGIQPDDGGQDERRAKFMELTQFAGGDGFNIATIMGFATLGMGDFVYDEDRLKGKRIGWNSDPDLDYNAIGTNPVLAAEYDEGVKRLTKGSGRSKLKKASFPDFTKGKGAKVEYPILSMAGAADWLVIPEFQRVYDTALSDGSKLVTQTWIDTFGHCVFSEQETEALWLEYFDWLGLAGGTYGTQPTPQDLEDRCLTLPGAIDGDTCNFNSAYQPGALFERIPPREDWPYAATH